MRARIPQVLESASFVAIVLIGLVVSILDAFSTFETLTAEATLFICSIILAYLIWQRFFQINRLGDDLKTVTQMLHSTLGGEIKLHHGRQAFITYATERIQQATNHIHIVTASTYGGMLYREKETEHYRKYLAALRSAAERGVKVRRIRGVHSAELLQQTVEELQEHLGSEFYIAVYPISNPREAPFFNTMQIDDEVAIGGIHKDAIEDVISITTTHPQVVRLIVDYFETFRSRSIVLNERARLYDASVTSLRDQLRQDLEFIDEANRNHRRSAKIVSQARKRLWICSTQSDGRPYDPLDTEQTEAARIYDAAITNAIESNPELEVRRVIRAHSLEIFHKHIKAMKKELTYPNYLLRFVLDQMPSIDMLIRDEDLILLGMRERETSDHHDSVIVVQNSGVVKVLARWYERYLWSYAIEVKNKKGIVQTGIEQVRKYLEADHS